MFLIQIRILKKKFRNFADLLSVEYIFRPPTFAIYRTIIFFSVSGIVSTPAILLVPLPAMHREKKKTKRKGRETAVIVVLADRER
jgi:hypothetical protein